MTRPALNRDLQGQGHPLRPAAALSAEQRGHSAARVHEAAAGVEDGQYI